MTQRSLDRPFRLLEEKAQADGKSLHESFFDELENYTRHKRVEDLADADLDKVVLTIGERAIQHTSVAEVGAKSIRVTLDEFCPDPTMKGFLGPERFKLFDSLKSGHTGFSAHVVYWLLDLPRRRLEVHTEPLPTGGFAELRIAGTGDSVSIPGTNAEVAVSTLLP